MHNSLLCSFAPNPLLELTLPIRRREVFPLPEELQIHVPEVRFILPVSRPRRRMPPLESTLLIRLPGHPLDGLRRIVVWRPATGTVYRTFFGTFFGTFGGALSRGAPNGNPGTFGGLHEKRSGLLVHPVSARRRRSGFTRPGPPKSVGRRRDGGRRPRLGLGLGNIV